MGPFVPNVITDELNLIVALLVGVAFGFVLEQAGFSSSRKLTGLFYGTDFTVLRVFFTAGITAMLGVLLLGKLGWLDTSIIYVHPTFLTSALIGGAIMGVGFVVGGYCPGTSFCGAAVGRIDAMMFVAGGLLGALTFGEAFPAIQGLYMDRPLGDPTLPAATGLPPGMVAIGFVLVAVTAFAAVGVIERRVNPDGPTAGFPVWRHRLAGVAVLVAAAGVAALPPLQARLLARANDAAYRHAHPPARMTADELAFRLLDEDPSLVLVDIRPESAYTAFTLPTAVNLTMEHVAGKPGRDVLGRRRTLKVFLADREDEAVTAATLAAQLGYERVAVLEGGLDAFRAQILSPSATEDTMLDEDTRIFRVAAAPRLTALIAARGAARPVVTPVKRVAGGCGV